jgi:transposase
VLASEEMTAKLEAALALVEALTKENKLLREQIELLRQRRFGRSSERLEAGQLDLFKVDGTPIVPEPPLATPAPKPKKKGHGRSELPAHLPRNVFVLDVPESERTCSCCGDTLKTIGTEVTERGRIIPARMVVDRYERRKYACPHGHEVRTAALPDGVIDGAKYDASVHAHVVVAKYQDHLPLNRLESIFKRDGVKLPRQVSWDMVVRVDELVAQPVLEQMRRELLAEEVLHADETSVTLRLEDQKGSKDSWVFGWRSLREVDQPKALVEFRPGRGRAGPTQFLGDWSGTLVLDGYAGYDEVCERNGIRRAGCWAHARRYFKEALDVGSKEAALVLVEIGRLFRVERAVNERVGRERLGRDAGLVLRDEVRTRVSSRILERIYGAAEVLDGARSTLPKSKLGKALKYLFNQRAPLTVFLEDARVPIHNNDAERDLRHVVTGRKNWLVFGSTRGGEVACRLYSLMLSCRQNGVDPEAYLADVLMAVATTPASEIANLTPWAWGARHRAD